MAQKPMPVDRKTHKATYTGTIAVDSALSAADLYSRAREWVLTAYNNPKASIVYSAPETGKLIAAASFNLKDILNSCDIRHEITIECENGKYTYTISKFTSQCGKQPPEEIEHTDLARSEYKKINDKTLEIISSLKEAMGRKKE